MQAEDWSYLLKAIVGLRSAMASACDKVEDLVEIGWTVGREGKLVDQQGTFVRHQTLHPSTNSCTCSRMAMACRPQMVFPVS